MAPWAITEARYGSVGPSGSPRKVTRFVFCQCRSSNSASGACGAFGETPFDFSARGRTCGALLRALSTIGVAKGPASQRGAGVLYWHWHTVKLVTFLGLLEGPTEP